MSQFPQSSPSGRFRRSLGFDLGQSQPTRLDVSRYSVTGPDDSFAQQLNGLTLAAGQFTNAIGNFAASANAERARKEREAEDQAKSVAAELDRAERNAAALRSAELLPQLIDQMDTGALKPLPDQKVEDFARTVVGTYAGTESQAYTDEMTRLLVPRLIGRQVELAQKGREIAQKESDDGVVSRVSLSDTWLNSLAALEDARKSPGMTPERMTSIALRSMMIAAEDGKGEVVDSMKAWLGAKAPEAQQKAKADLLQVDARLAQVEARKQAQVVNDFQNQMSRLFIDHAPISQKRALLASWDGKVPDEIRRGFSASIDNEEQQVASAFERQAREIAKAQASQEIYTAAAAAMQSGQFATMIDDDFRRTLADGTEVSEPRNQVRDRIMELQLQQIDDQMQGQPESVRTRAGIAYAAPNDILPERYTGVLTAGLGAAQTWMQADNKDQQVSAATVKALGLARDLKTTAPNLYGKVDARLRDFYDLALAAQELPGIGGGTPDSDQRALQVAMKAIRDGSAGRSVDATTVRLKNPHKNAKNAGAIETMMSQWATTYTRIGLGNDKAAEAAAKRVKSFVKSNGYAIDLSAATVPQYIANEYEMVSVNVLEWWVNNNKAYAEQQGIKRDNLVLMPTRDGQFTVVDAENMGLPVSRNGIFTLKELDAVWQAASRKSQGNIKKQTMDMQDRQGELRKQPFTFGLVGNGGFTTVGAQ